MYEELTPEYIKADMLEDFSIADTREGSYVDALVSPVAYEIWKAYTALGAVVPMVYVDGTSGQYADRRASEYGIYRKPGVKASAPVLFGGIDGTVIPAGKVFLTERGLAFTLDAQTVIENGGAEGTLTAEHEGAAYNVPAGAIRRQTVNLPGIETVESGEAMGGADAESTGALVARFYAYIQRTPTSGNAAHYEHWALEMQGIGAVKVFPLWAGPGTVKILAVGPEGMPVDPVIIGKTYGYIESVRPIGADVTVCSAESLEIDVAASVLLSAGTTAGIVEAALRDEVRKYLKSIAFKEYRVVYNRIAYLLLGIPGVTDFTALTVNGGTADINVGADEVPTAGEIEVTA